MAESRGHGTVWDGERGTSSRTAITQVTAEGMPQPGPKTSSVLCTGNRKFIFLSTTRQLSFASFLLLLYADIGENKPVRQKPVRHPSSPCRSQVSEAHTGVR